MKKVISIFIGVMLLGSFSFVSSAKDLKIGYVNFIEVFNEYKKTKEYDDMLSKKQDEKEKQLKQKSEELEKMQSRLSLLKDKEKEKEQQKFETAMKDLRQVYGQARLDLRKERDEKMKEIFEDIAKAINNYAKKHNYDFIFNEGNRNIVLYGDKAADLTADILKIVNEMAKK
ncbi:MAG: OmpH family outer membrane protein [Candidatus Omnitrophota bacterium]|nr:OmpH family outer membrane protein [Candidatus Omnitrophota bacterium]